MIFLVLLMLLSLSTSIKIQHNQDKTNFEPDPYY